KISSWAMTLNEAKATHSRKAEAVAAPVICIRGEKEMKRTTPLARKYNCRSGKYLWRSRRTTSLIAGWRDTAFASLSCREPRPHFISRRESMQQQIPRALRFTVDAILYRTPRLIIG